jgi:hypothetical protein
MWIECFEEDTTSPHNLILIESTGKVVAYIEVPSRTTAYEVGSDYLLGIQTGDDGIEVLLQYQLRR